MPRTPRARPPSRAAHLGSTKGRPKRAGVRGSAAFPNREAIPERSRGLRRFAATPGRARSALGSLPVRPKAGEEAMFPRRERAPSSLTRTSRPATSPPPPPMPGPGSCSRRWRRGGRVRARGGRGSPHAHCRRSRMPRRLRHAIPGPLAVRSAPHRCLVLIRYLMLHASAVPKAGWPANLTYVKFDVSWSCRCHAGCPRRREPQLAWRRCG
jgi:hypothetical protein